MLTRPNTGTPQSPRVLLYTAIPNGPLASNAKLRVAHAPGMPGTFSPTPRASDPDMHHGTCVTHVPWCMPGSLTSGFLWSRWRGKCSRHSRRTRKPQLYVSGKRPMHKHRKNWQQHVDHKQMILSWLNTSGDTHGWLQTVTELHICLENIAAMQELMYAKASNCGYLYRIDRVKFLMFVCAQWPVGHINAKTTL